jgi:hypothetical protein
MTFVDITSLQAGMFQALAYSRFRATTYVYLNLIYARMKIAFILTEQTNIHTLNFTGIKFGVLVSCRLHITAKHSLPLRPSNTYIHKV